MLEVVLIMLFVCVRSFSKNSELSLQKRSPLNLSDRKLEQTALFQETLESFNYGASQMTLLEIGVDIASSLQDWQQWFKDIRNITLVGFSTKIKSEFHAVHNKSFHFEFGALDNKSLSELCFKYGPFGIIIDRSSSYDPARSSVDALEHLFPCMRNTAHYFIENPIKLRHSESKDGTLVDITLAQYMSRIHVLMHHK